MVDYSNIPRDSRRVPLETRVQFKFDRFSGFLSDFSANISPGGMFIRTRTPQPAGTVLEFEFRLGDGFELIKGRGEVVWVRPEDEGPARPAGMGLRFLELSLGSKELIYRIVDHHIQQGGTPFDVTQHPSDPVPVPPPAPEPEGPGGFDPSPYELSRDDWMKAREPLPAAPLPGASPAETPAAAPPLDTAGAGAPAGPLTEVSPIRPAPPAVTPKPPATTPAPAEKPAPVPAIPEDTGPPATGVEKITFEKAFGGTDVILWGNGALHSGSYVRSRIEGNPPRELIRISGIKRPAPAARLVVGTPEVLQVRTGLHAGNELHVVLDLAGPKVTVTRVEEGENRLRIHLQKQ